MPVFEFGTPKNFQDIKGTAAMRPTKPREASEGEEAMAQHLNAYQIPFEREFRFHPVRQWRFDFRLLNTNIAIECEGGIWSNGAHTRGKHFEEDAIKYAEAILKGFRVFRFSTGQIKKGVAIEYILKALKA